MLGFLAMKYIREVGHTTPTLGTFPSLPNAMGWMLAVVFLALIVRSPALAAPDDFYAGKQVTLIVGTGPGGGHDTSGRFLARHIGRHIPGRPKVTVVNMPGASSVRAANYLANVGPQDGTELLLIIQTLPVVQVTASDRVRFDLAQFNWIGNITNSVNVFVVRRGTGVRTLADAQSKELIVGSVGANSFAGMITEVMNKSLGTRFKTVFGYVSGGALDLAFERGEVDGRAAATWSGVKAKHPNWLHDGSIDILLQVGLTKELELPDVPLLIDLARNEKDRQLFQFYSSLVALGGAIAVGPGVPPLRVATLRRAFDAAMKDPDMLRDAAKIGLEIRPLGGEALQTIIFDMVRTDPRLLDTKER